ncbi:MAG: DUF3445 domain-containing protein [Pseudomonadota bacterium]
MDARAMRYPGLSPLDDANWLVDQPDGAAQVAYRGKLIDERRGDVIACLPEGEDASAELLDDLTLHLGLEGVDQRDPLSTIGRLVCEDFCILARGAEPEYRLVAAVLCFPSHWVLAEKIGKPLTVIHDPVPDYGDDLAARVNRVFEAIRPEQMLVRQNWMLHSDPELFAPRGRAKAGGAVYLRSERQTFRRLKRTGAVVFGIRTSVAPVSGLTDAERLGLLGALEAQSEAMIRYKGGAKFHAYARQVLAEEPGPESSA